MTHRCLFSAAKENLLLRTLTMTSPHPGEIQGSLPILSSKVNKSPLVT